MVKRGKKPMVIEVIEASQTALETQQAQPNDLTPPGVPIVEPHPIRPTPIIDAALNRANATAHTPQDVARFNEMANNWRTGRPRAPTRRRNYMTRGRRNNYVRRNTYQNNWRPRLRYNTRYRARRYPARRRRYAAAGWSRYRTRY